MSREGSGSASIPGTGLPATPGAALAPEEPVEPRTDAPSPPRGSVEELAAFVCGEAGRPIDVWAIAALLESSGLRDRDAAERYGRRDIFALAQAVQVRLARAPAVEPPAQAQERAPLAGRVARFARLYGRGSFFFLPLALQLVALLTVGVSQYASVTFTTREASIVAVAAGAGFVASAGTIQALGYLGPLFEEPGKHILTERMAYVVLAFGVLVVAAVGLALWGVVSLTGGYPAGALHTALVYYALVAVQSLVNAVLYMLHRYGLMVAATVVGLAAVALLHRRGLPIEQVHWIGLGIAIAAELAVVALLLRRRARRTAGPMRLARAPRPALLARRAAPFFVYGTMYFAFLLVDRVAAWAAGSHPLPLWFRTDYEVGADWALLAVLVALAFLEVVVEDFSELLVPMAERHRVDRLEEHNRAMLGFWRRQLVFVAALAALGAWLAVVAAWGLHRLGALAEAERYYADEVTHTVFAGAVIGYALLALGIANGVFVMSLARPWRVLRALGPALAVAGATGAALTTFGPYQDAVWGLVAGAAVYAVLTGVEARRLLARADYHSYAAF